ncbi:MULTISPECIES: MFS transporter [Actinoalloteichus]|uniref:Arabinose efflux permease family protein n=1 Tax=Actinoalloteichus fjordicus TaxID=1612552 RepID=A0AAC9LFJ9_9PSEU|nr:MULTISPECIES: MFS transporter [Actinoalloteichus]APU15954.1 arabinose efflux permease family protein [Actinoalloteichus fjordicus]APU22017.1 arabinose efflux permease family protein [Actinoalloteichus sp. GBA129-24]
MAEQPPVAEQEGTRRGFRLRMSVAPLRVRGYRLLFVAQAASEFGNAFHFVALPWLVYQRGGDAAELGLIVAAYGLCRLITTPLGGVCTDRFGAWRVMMVSDLGRTTLTAALAVIAALDVGGFGLISALAAATGLFAGLFQPAAWAITPRLLPPEQLQSGMALLSTATFAAGLAGPGIAGLVVLVLDPASALAVDAATFAVSAAFLAAVGSALRGAAPATARSSTDGGFLGLLRESRLLRDVLVVTAAANLTMGGMSRVGLPSLAEGELGAGAVGLGGLLASFTGGCLAGGLLAAGVTGLRRRGRVAMISGLVLAVSVFAVPFVGLFGALAVLFVAGAASTVTNVMIVTVIQHGTPAPLLGRVMAAVLFCGLGLFPVSVAVSGFVVERFGTTSIFVITGVLLLGAFSFGLSRREITGR